MSGPWEKYAAPAAAAPPATPDSFREQYGPAAERAARELGVSPSAILGQWGLETGWGKSIIPGTNNLGNIKDVSGKGVRARDNMTGSNDAYRAYESPDAFVADYVSLIKRKYPGAVGAGDDAQKFAASTSSSLRPARRPPGRSSRAAPRRCCQPSRGLRRHPRRPPAHGRNTRPRRRHQLRARTTNRPSPTRWPAWVAE